MRIALVRAPRRLASIACAMLFATFAAGCGKISIPAFLNLDPTQQNTLSIEALGQSADIPLSGGIHGRVVIDTAHLLTPQGVIGFIEGDDFSVAGESVSLLGLKTGTLCAKENPADPVSGTVLIRVFKPSSANLHFSALSTSKLIRQLLGDGDLPFTADASNVPLQLDFGKLLKFQLDGAIRTTAVIMGQLPDDLPLIGGAPFTMKATLVSATKASDAPLLAECQDYFAQ